MSLPDPDNFRNGPLESFAASMEIPKKILTGMQTGERASTEDADEWAKTCKSRRQTYIIPNIRRIINRLKDFGLLKDHEWPLSWTDLTESSMDQKVERAGKMADINQKMAGTGEIIFLGDEIRASVGMEPLSLKDKYPEVDEDDEEDDEDPNDGEDDDEE